MNDGSLKKLNPVVTMLLGILAFLIGSLVGNIPVVYAENFIFALPLAGGIGALLLGFFIKFNHKLWRMTLSGFIGLPLGLVASFALIEGVGSLIPSIGLSLEDTIVPDILVETIMGLVFGLISAAIIYGRKAIGLFAVVCGLGGIPGGIAVGFMNTNMHFKTQLANMAEPFSKLDYNLMAMYATMGLGFGLAIALYNNRLVSQQNK